MTAEAAQRPNSNASQHPLLQTVHTNLGDIVAPNQRYTGPKSNISLEPVAPK